jgi:NAD(P)-dependent dehydrogenase (short-subunit alcohol dehydrogenase family)
MAYLDSYTTPLTASAAAHLLRRATFGPTNQEVTDFTGKTALEAVDILINNASYRATPPPPVEMDITRSDAGSRFWRRVMRRLAVITITCT